MQRGSALTTIAMVLGLAALTPGAFAQQPPGGRGRAAEPAARDEERGSGAAVAGVPLGGKQ